MPNYVDRGAQVLGEKLTGYQRWSNGRAPLALPAPVLIGAPECFAQGETLANGLPVEQLVSGFPAGCFPTTPPPNPDYAFGAEIGHCATQRFWAGALALVYGGDAQDLAAYLQPRFSGATLNYWPVTTAYPAYALLVHPDYCFLLLAGTSTLAQVLVQVLDGGRAPVDFGAFGTGSLWYDFATLVLKSLGAVGVVDSRPLTWIGHSYGGASSHVGAARSILGQPGRAVRYLTFGAPKPGDKRLVDVLAPLPGVSIANNGDLITALPPDLDTLIPLARYLPIPWPSGWLEWQYPPNYSLAVAGVLLPNVYQQLDTFVVLAAVMTAITDGVMQVFAEHNIGAYQAAVAKRCPGPTVLIPPGQVLGVEIAAVQILGPGQVIGVVARTLIQHVVFPGQVLGFVKPLGVVAEPGQVLGAMATIEAQIVQPPGQVLGVVVLGVESAEPGQVLGVIVQPAALAEPGQVLGVVVQPAAIAKPGQVLGVVAVEMLSTAVTASPGQVLGVQLAAFAIAEPGQVLGAATELVERSEPGQVLGATVVVPAVAIAAPGQVLAAAVGTGTIPEPGQVLGVEVLTHQTEPVTEPGAEVIGVIVNTQTPLAAQPGQVLGVAVNGETLVGNPVTIFDRQYAQGNFYSMSTTANTAIYTLVIPAGTMGPLSIIKARIFGEFLMNSGAPTWTFSVQIGSTLVWSATTPSFGAVNSYMPFCFELWLANLNALNQNILNGRFTLAPQSTPVTGSGNLNVTGLRSNPFDGLANVDTSQAQTLTLLAKPSISSSLVGLTRYHAYAELVP